MRTRLIPMWPFDLRRQTWLGAAGERLRVRRSRIAVQGAVKPGRALPSVVLPKPAQAQSPTLPVESTHGDEAFRWRMLATLRAFRHNLILRRLSRLDEKLAVARVSRTLALEEESRAANHHGEAHERRSRFLKAVPERLEHELERYPARFALLVTTALWLLETSIMIMPWHLFGAPSLPFLSYGGQTSTASAFALLRALLLSLVLVAAAKLVGRTIRAQVNESPMARRIADTVFVSALVVSTLLLLRATAEMQEAYLAIVSGGVSTTLSSSVFFVVTLFVVVASCATGFWMCSPLAERRRRFDKSEHAAWQPRRRAAKRLDRCEAAICRLEIRRSHLLEAARELELEQRALLEAMLAERRDTDWPLYGLTPQAAGKGGQVQLEPIGEADKPSFSPRAPREVPGAELSDAQPEAPAEPEESIEPTAEIVEEPAPQLEGVEPYVLSPATTSGSNGVEASES